MSVRKILLIIFSLLFLGSAANASQWFAATTGTPSGNGSQASPWDLQTALNQPASVQPGDTIWVRGGTYANQFNGNLNGTAANPIIVRNYNGEHVTIDGLENAFVLYVAGSYTWYWGMEITTSCSVRVTANPVCPFGIGDYGPGNKFINCIIHDTLQGFSGYNSSPDTEVSGNLVYYNGIVSPDRNHGHGIYAQNDTGQKTISDNFVGDNADEGIQIYGSGSSDLINFTIDGNILYNSSSWPTPDYQYNLLIAGGATRQNITVQNNYSYFTPNNGGTVQFGQYTQGLDMSITGNVFADGYVTSSIFLQTGPIVFTGNTIVALADTFHNFSLNYQYGQSLGDYTFDYNTYWDQSQYNFYSGSTTDGFNFSGSSLGFSAWQSATGFDTHSIYQAAAPTGLWVYVRPNKYEPKRANVAIYNWNLLPAVSVDLSGVLGVGDTYVIQDAQNFYGPPVASGTYAGGTVSVPMTGLTKATPVGFVAPAHTAPTFGTFVVLGSGTGIPNPTPPPTAGTATFAGSDTATQGNWLGKYGSDGYSLAGAAQSLPGYDLTFSAVQLPEWTWAPGTSDSRALETDANADRLAATWYSPAFLYFDLDITDSQTHQIAVYALDWDSRGRTETIRIVDGVSGTVLDTRTIPSSDTSTTSANFVDGTYLVWNVSGHVAVTVTSNAGPNGVVSGIFWGGGAPFVAATSGTPQAAATGSAFAPLVAGVSSSGNPASGVTVTFAAPGTGASGTFAGGSSTAIVMTDAQGHATAPTFTANALAGGPYTVTATASGATSPASFLLTNLVQVGPPATVSASGGGSQSAATNAAFQTPLQATVYDAMNNPVANVTVAFAAPASGASGTFTGGSNTASAMTNPQGIATAPVFTANGAAGGPYTVTATVSGLAPANYLLTNTAVQTGPCAGDCAAFSGSDTLTEGSWEAEYGGDGYLLANSAQSTPWYASVAVQGPSNYTWNGGTAAPSALQIPGGSLGIAACWYGATFDFDVNVGTGSHQVALYVLDWDNRGRAEKVQIFDANSSSTTPLDTETVSNFTTGSYLIWNVSGHVKIVITGTGGPNAVVSGLFFGGAPAPAAVNSFSKDTVTEGAWGPKYGADGYSLANSAQSLPAYATFVPQNVGSYTWSASSVDPRALQVPGSTSGIAATWYGGTFSFDLNVGAASHQVALYVLDWDNGGRSETIQIFDANSSSTTPLDAETISNFSSGAYLIWNISGHVRILVTGTGGPNAVVSGVFFGGAPAPAAASSFTEDTSTEGAWEGKYGANGYSLANSAQSPLQYASLAMLGQGSYTWNPATSDPRALEVPGSATGIAATWYGATFSFDLSVGASSHQVAFYVLDWDNGGRAETIEIFDANSNSTTPLDTETISSFSTGAYLIWNITGHVRIVVTGTSGPNAVVSGVFFQ